MYSIGPSTNNPYLIPGSPLNPNTMNLMESQFVALRAPYFCQGPLVNPQNQNIFIPFTPANYPSNCNTEGSQGQTA